MPQIPFLLNISFLIWSLLTQRNNLAPSMSASADPLSTPRYRPHHPRWFGQRLPIQPSLRPLSDATGLDWIQK